MGWFKFFRKASPHQEPSEFPARSLPEKVSERLVDQRLRNRIMEELWSLSEGTEGVRKYGAIEYFNGFFDWFPDEDHEPYPNSAITCGERAALSDVLKLMNEACEATPKKVRDDELIRSGWPSRIAPIAKEALALFLERGRFSEETEESEPSTPVPWPSSEP